MGELGGWGMEKGCVIGMCEDCGRYVIMGEEGVMGSWEVGCEVSVENRVIGEGGEKKGRVDREGMEVVGMSDSGKLVEKDVVSYVLWSMIGERKGLCGGGLGMVGYKMGR